MKSSATTVAEYLEQLPEDRKAAISKVRSVIRKHLPKGYVECFAYGMIGYAVPLTLYPNTYNGQPLMIAALGSQKNYMVVHLMAVYGHKETESWFRKKYAESGKKLDMGKACVRFKKLEDLPLELIGEVIARVPVQKYIDFCEQYRRK